MIKSITTSPEAEMCRKSDIQRDFSTVLRDIPAMNKKINQHIQKGEDRQRLSKRSAAKIRSR